MIDVDKHGEVDIVIMLPNMVIRKGRVYVYGMWQYKVTNIKIHWRVKLLKTNMICTIWVMYKHTNKGKKSIDFSAEIIKFKQKLVRGEFSGETRRSVACRIMLRNYRRSRGKLSVQCSLE